MIPLTAGERIVAECSILESRERASENAWRAARAKWVAATVVFVVLNAWSRPGCVAAPGGGLEAFTCLRYWQNRMESEADRFARNVGYAARVRHCAYRPAAAEALVLKLVASVGGRDAAFLDELLWDAVRRSVAKAAATSARSGARAYPCRFCWRSATNTPLPGDWVSVDWVCGVHARGTALARARRAADAAARFWPLPPDAGSGGRFCEWDHELRRRERAFVRLMRAKNGFVPGMPQYGGEDAAWVLDQVSGGWTKAWWSRGGGALEVRGRKAAVVSMLADLTAEAQAQQVRKPTDHGGVATAADQVRAGASLKSAARAAGVSRTTLRRHLSVAESAPSGPQGVRGKNSEGFGG